KFVFGPLADQKFLAEKWGPENSFIFFVTVTGTIILVSALSSLLYHYGILQRVVQGLAWVMQRVMKTSGSESLAAAANIFMGQTEAPLVIKPSSPSWCLEWRVSRVACSQPTWPSAMPRAAWTWRGI